MTDVTMPAKAPRGRPRAFDPDIALKQASDLFLRQGFAATSLDDLADATGLKRSSLYGAFGNKLDLYLMTMDRFAEHMAAGLESAFASNRPLGSKLETFFENALDIYYSAEGGSCLIWCTAPAEAHMDARIGDRLGRALQRLDSALESYLIEAQTKGALAAGAVPHALSRLIAATLHSLALRVRAGMAREEATGFYRSMIDIVLSQARIA